MSCASDPIVSRIESRGGIVIGKTNTPEFGAGANTFNDVFGVTHNPWGLTANAGGHWRGRRTRDRRNMAQPWIGSRACAPRLAIAALSA